MTGIPVRLPRRCSVGTFGCLLILNDRGQNFALQQACRLRGQNHPLVLLSLLLHGSRPTATARETVVERGRAVVCDRGPIHWRQTLLLLILVWEADVGPVPRLPHRFPLLLQSPGRRPVEKVARMTILLFLT